LQIIPNDLLNDLDMIKIEANSSVADDLIGHHREETVFQCGPLDTLDTYGTEAVDNYNTNAEKVINNYISCGKPVEIMRTEPSPASTR